MRDAGRRAAAGVDIVDRGEISPHARQQAVEGEYATAEREHLDPLRREGLRLRRDEVKHFLQERGVRERPQFPVSLGANGQQQGHRLAGGHHLPSPVVVFTVDTASGKLTPSGQDRESILHHLRPRLKILRMVFTISLASAPVKADHNPGGPVRNGNQCWYNASKRHSDFGYWAACPASPGALMRQTPAEPNLYSHD